MNKNYPQQKIDHKNMIELLQSLAFFAITLKNYKLCCSKLNTPKHLLFGRQLLYSPNTTSIVVRNVIVLSSTTDKINRISNHYWDRWGHEYVVNLREIQGTSKLNTNSLKINVNDIVLVFYEKEPRHLRIAIVLPQ